jgi:hypothetical protein
VSPKDDLARMAADADRREAGDLTERNLLRRLKLVDRVLEAAAQHDGQGRAEGGLFAELRGGVAGVEIHDGLTA